MKSYSELEENILLVNNSCMHKNILESTISTMKNWFSVS